MPQAAYPALPSWPPLQLDPAAVQRLQALLLGSRVSTVRLIRKCPRILEMEWGDLMARLVGMKARHSLLGPPPPAPNPTRTNTTQAPNPTALAPAAVQPPSCSGCPAARPGVSGCPSRIACTMSGWAGRFTLCPPPHTHTPPPPPPPPSAPPPRTRTPAPSALQELFPGCDVARMVELAPAAFLDSPWPATQRQLAAASTLLRRGLQGADVCFMFQVWHSLAAGTTAAVRGEQRIGSAPAAGTAAAVGREPGPGSGPAAQARLVSPSPAHRSRPAMLLPMGSFTQGQPIPCAAAEAALGPRCACPDLSPAAHALSLAGGSFHPV